MRIFLFILGVFAAIVCFKARCGRWSVVRRLRWGGGGRSHELRVFNISTMLGDLGRGWCVV
jgi:hypothetical protein